jgi:ABC-type cobalamin transport system permease subunit
MTSVSTVHLVVAFVVIALVTWVIRRWSGAFGIGVVGLVLLMVPEVIRYSATSPKDLFYPLCTVAGILIVAADLTRRGKRHE